MFELQDNNVKSEGMKALVAAMTDGNSSLITLSVANNQAPSELLGRVEQLASTKRTRGRRFVSKG
jgi:hypothetical protein